MKKMLVPHLLLTLTMLGLFVLNAKPIALAQKRTVHWKDWARLGAGRG